MSTRKANFITLDELTDEVGKDVVRYFFNMRNISSHMVFDLALAKKHSDENPVFYLQYAHARISSIMREVKREDLEPSVDNLSLLTNEHEQNLLKALNNFKEKVLFCAENFEAHLLCNYLEELAAAYHRFHRFCRILGTERKLAEARLALAVATKIVLKNGLSILGVSAPERM
jgi:arginyl-tRNA synthetase